VQAPIVKKRKMAVAMVSVSDSDNGSEEWPFMEESKL
jgi:hypothetical protein